MTRTALAALWICGIATAQPVKLRMTADSWIPRTFETGSIPADKAATFAAGQDRAQGPTLSVGPWRAGRNSARYDSREPLRTLEGQLTGWYRTVSLLPYTAAVYVSFYKDSARLRQVKFDLPPTASWTRFARPIRRPPPGTTAVQIGVGLAEMTEGRVDFAGLAVSAEPYRVEFPAGPAPLTRPMPPAKLQPAPFHRIVESNGASWFVAPDGVPFYSVGVDGPRFATPEEGRKLFDIFRSLSFNSLAGWTGYERWGPLNDGMDGALAAFRSLKTADIKGDYDLLISGNHAFPDPFDPRWEIALREQVRRLAAPVKGKPWFVGFFADNEASHRDLHRQVYTTNCAAALRRFLEGRYANIGALDAAWGATYASFDDLIRAKPDPALRQGRMYEDYRAFKREIVRRYAQTLLRVIREEDPGRLVFSNRFYLGDVDGWTDVIDLYRDFDAIGLNMYPANLSAGLNESERAVIRFIHEKAGKPVMTPEWSIPALDSGLYANWDKLDWSYRETVDTQTERARQAARVVTDLYNIPYHIGAHWFIWKDVNNETRQANRGLFQSNGDPWTALHDALAAANRRLLDRRR